MTDQTFADLGVAEPICRALADEGYTNPTPIQLGAIPTLLAGRDLLGLAQTGTGKTAAFSVPILQRLAEHARPARPRTPRALILAPTRELAVQINDSMKLYGRHLKLRSTAVFGGVGIGAQIETLRRGVDILVATPGRLLDLCDQRMCDLGSLEILTLDEADRMLDMGFVRDVRRIMKLVPKERQTLLLSATMPTDIESLATDILRDPAKVEIAHAGKTVDRIAQSVHFVAQTLKRDLLSTLLADEAMTRVMVFTRTKRGADRVAQHLNRSAISAEAIHGNKSQNHRQRTLEGFRTGRTRVLVATDIAARGLDIDLVSHVFNFELPHEPEAYVHRIGRTARAGTEGTAIAFCAPEERADLKAIERLTRQTLAVAVTPEIVRTAASESSARDERIDERFEARDNLRNARGGERGAGRGGRGRSNAPRSRDQSDAGGPAERHARGPSSYDPTKPRTEKPVRTAPRSAPRGERHGEARGDRGEGRGDVRQASGDRPARSHAPRGEGRSEQRGEARHASGDRPARSHAPRGEGRSEHRGEQRGEQRGEARHANGDRPARNHAPRGEGRSEHRGEQRGEARHASGDRPARSHAPRSDARGSSGDARPTRGGNTGGKRDATAGGPSPWSNWTSRGNR